jgi:hypothetical protein
MCCKSVSRSSAIQYRTVVTILTELPPPTSYISVKLYICITVSHLCLKGNQWICMAQNLFSSQGGYFQFTQIFSCTVVKEWPTKCVFQNNHIFRISSYSYMFRRIRSAILREPNSRSDLSTDNIQTVSTFCFQLTIYRRYPHSAFTWQYTDGIHILLSTDNIQTVSTFCFHLFRIHDLTYVQFRQDYIGLPEDGAPDATKHVGARLYSKYIVIL